MGASSSYRPPDRGLAPHASNPVMKRTYEGDLMALNIPSALLLLTRPSHVFFHFRLILHQLCNWKPRSSDLYALCTAFTFFFTLMPRERGKPSHGSAWYAFAARRKRMQRMERALSIARTQILHRRIELRMPPRSSVAEAIVEPPMAYVEEVIPEEPTQVPLEHLLFTVPDNWAPPSDFRAEASMPVTKKQHDSENELTREEFSTCFIEEEIPEETASQTAVPKDGATLDESERSEGAGREADLGRHREAASSEPVEMHQGDTTKECGTVFKPPPISSMQNQRHVPPPLLHPDLLDLLFDLRGQMADHVHRGILMGQRLDMLFDAFSNSPPGRRWPTCLQFFVIPAKEHAQDMDATSDATR